MSETASDDAQLLDAWRGGDARAGEQLVRRHASRLRRFFANKVDAGADDLCQQTWAACIEARDRIEHDGASRSFASYLFAAARHRLINYYRQHQRQAQQFDPLVTSVAELGHGASANPSGALAQHERRAKLHEALRSLPLDAQIALELHYWEHLSVREIGDALGVPEGTIKARLARARQQLHQRLHPQA
ncbi:MAG: sigma-70 family RNA polymerase sigma factor [Nannocystaceae bacterium]|nr:sigma-70 family RNA polymerase sigma factor [Nannocystaceae bacterium]